MTAPINNENALKFRTSTLRKKLCEEWCNHLINGYSKESFPLCDPQTFRKYCKLYPIDFDTEKIKRAERESRMFWEKIGVSGMTGKIKKFNATIWIFNMKNRFGWSSNPTEKEEKGACIHFGFSPSQFIQNADKDYQEKEFNCKYND